MSGKVKKILISLAVIAVCVAVIVTVLVLTVSHKGGDGTHIQIEGGTAQGGGKGEIDIVLIRERLEKLTLDNNGLPVRSRDETVIDFSKSRDNIFGIDDNLLVAPGCYFSAEMLISNSKPYGFEYWLEITPEGGGNLLSDQLELTVLIDGETFIKRTLQSGLTTKVFPAVQSGRTSAFTVKLEYLDTSDNNQTKNTTLAFDMIVHAKLT